MSEQDETHIVNIKPNWRAQLDERQRKAVAFAEIYIEQFRHGAIGHNDYILIARLAELLDIATGIREAPKPPSGDLVLTFGKYNGQALSAVNVRDPDYIAWLAREGRDPDVRAACQALLTPAPASGQPAGLGPGPGQEQTEDLPF